MRVAIIFSDGVKQINFTPENDQEKMALKLITPDDNINLAVKSGTFGENYLRPFSMQVNRCQGGYLRAYQDDESIMLVLSPKPSPRQVTPDIDMDLLKNIWTAANPTHEINQDTGEDIFWTSLALVVKNYLSHVVENG